MTNIPLIDFGVDLREGRKRAGLTQEALAKKVLVGKKRLSASYTSKMESGLLPPPSRKVAVKIAEALEMPNEPVTLYVSPKDKDAVKRLAFLLEANAAGAEDVKLKIGQIEDEDGEAEEEEEHAISNRNVLPTASGVSSIARTDALGVGGGLRAILDPPTLGSVVDQIVEEASFTPEQRILAERLILEHARAVRKVLTKEHEDERR